MHVHDTPEAQVNDQAIRKHLLEEHGDDSKDCHKFRSCIARHLSYHPDHRLVDGLHGTLEPSAKAQSEGGTVEA